MVASVFVSTLLAGHSRSGLQSALRLSTTEAEKNKIRHEPIILECTSESNISFDKSLAFEAVEEVELVADGKVRLYARMR
jgi:hypothetical protein